MDGELRPQPLHHSFPLPDRSYLGLVRRDIGRLAISWGLSETEVSRLNIVVSEMTSNLVKHTPHGGELLVRAMGPETNVAGIEIICLDTGPGMRDPARMLEDGTSTYGSAGQGLGAIRRQADEFDLYSTPELGTAILARLIRRGRKLVAPPHHRCGAVVLPKPGEEACGDGWAIRPVNTGTLLLATDGLGHGPDAEQATLRAIETFLASPETDPVGVLNRLHTALRGTRGMVGAVALIESATHTLHYCGVGNIAGRLMGIGTVKSLVSYNGIIGHTLPRALMAGRYELTPHTLLLLASDGLGTRWDWLRYPGLVTHDLALIAAVLFRDSSRRTDDTVVLLTALT